MKKRALLKLPSAEVAEELFVLLTEEERRDKEVLSSIIFDDPAIQYIPGGHVFNYVMASYRELDSLKLVRYPLGIMETGISNYFYKHIIPQKEIGLLPVMDSAYEKILTGAGASPSNIVERQKQLRVTYYSETGNEAELNPAVIDWVQNALMKEDIAGMQARDAQKYTEFMEPYLSGKEDSTKTTDFSLQKRFSKNHEMVSLSYKLREAAEAVYNTSHDKKVLEQATRWAKQANEWVPHFSSAAVYAGLLFKTGRRQEAVDMMKLASEDFYIANYQEIVNLLISNSEKMKTGKAPKNLWKRG